MRESCLGIITSIAVHSCMIPLLVAASLTVDSRPGKVVEIDFSLINDQLKGYTVPGSNKTVIKKKQQAGGGTAISKRMTGPAGPTQKNLETLPVKEQMKPPPAPTVVTASDTRGETVIHGVAATYADSSGFINSLQSHGGTADGTSVGGSGGGWGGGQGGGQGSGQGAGESTARDYSYIRDAIMRNIKYPDEAIRSGIEGRVLVSFIVLENGTTSKIKVISGSGCRLLDESARRAVAITRIDRKVPYRVIVRLPIVYKLQG